MKRYHASYILMLFTLAALLLGCSGRQTEPENGQSSIEQSVAATLSSIAAEHTSVAADVPTISTPIPQTSLEPTWLNTAELAGFTLPPELAGLVFRLNNQLWLVNANGQPALIGAEIYEGALAPDLTRLVYVSSIYEAEDLVLRNLNTGDEQQLTDTGSIHEGAAQWWAAQPEMLVFNQVPVDQGGPWAGYLGAVDLASGERLDLDMESASYNGFTLSPDSRTIAYDDAGSPVLYVLNEGRKPLNMADYGLDFERYAALAWSPDGQTLAFYASRISPTSGVTEAAIVLLNLATNQTTQLHLHHSLGQRGGPEIAFSPDGQWLAAVNPGEEAMQQYGPMALWVIAVDGSNEQYLGYGTGPVWSPDSTQLLFTHWPPLGQSAGSFQQDAHTTLVKVGEWNLLDINDLLGSFLLDWYPLP